MTKRLLLIISGLVAAIALPASASAKVFPDVVSIHVDSKFVTDEIYGSVESKAPKCEPNRTILLFYSGGNKRGSFSKIHTTTTDSFGGYEIEAGDVGEGIFPGGDYFVRVKRDERSGDVCRRDDSRVQEVFGGF